MQIDTIHYSRKASDGQYANAELGMHAKLEEGDDPVQCAQYLQSLVTGTLHEQARAAARSDEQRDRDHELAREIERKGRDLERMEAHWTQARAFLEHHGIDVSRYTDVPF